MGLDLSELDEHGSHVGGAAGGAAVEATEDQRSEGFSGGGGPDGVGPCDEGGHGV